MSRGKIIGHKLDQGEIDARLAHYVKKRQRLVSRIGPQFNEQASTRHRQIELPVSEAVFAHLGYPVEDGLKSRLVEAADHAKEYFYGDWWMKPNNLQDLARFVDRDGDYAPQAWHQPMLVSVLACDWADRWDTALEIFEWVDDRVARGFTEESDGDLDVSRYLLLASIARSKPLTCESELRTHQERGEGAHRRLLRDAVLAVAERDDAKFAMLTSKIVKQFLKTVIDKVPNHLFWVDCQFAVIWAVAKRRGLNLPDLNAQEDAVIPRTESIFEPVTSGEVTGGPSLDQDALDEGLIQAISEYDCNAVPHLMADGADPDREQSTDIEGVTLLTSAKQLLIAMRDLRDGLEIDSDPLQRAASACRAEMRGACSDDELDDAIDFLCDQFCLPRQRDEPELPNS